MPHFLLVSRLLQARTEYLRRKSRAALQAAGGGRDDADGEQSGGSGAVEHLNLFPLEESAEKKGNDEYLKEKQEEKVPLSSQVFPAASTEFELLS